MCNSLLRSIRFVAFSLGVLFASRADGLRAEEGGLSDEEAVRAVVALHVEGVATADREKLERAWDVELGRVFFIEESQVAPLPERLVSRPAAELFDLWTAPSAPADPDARAEILSVEIQEGRFATVRLDFAWRGSILAETLTLAKTNGQWRIVTKFFVEREEDGASAHKSSYGG